jgi:Tfp pilus assembly protein PilF
VRRTLTILLALPLVALVALAALAATPSPSNLTKALEAQHQLTEKRPQDAGVWNDYGNLLLLANRPDEAESAYRQAVTLDPKKASALFNLGLLEQQRGHHKEALTLFQQVVAAEPQHAWAHYQIGSIYESWKLEKKAVGEYSRAFSLDPQLAFRDVNPQVVDSKLVTQSMLTAYREGARAPEAPKIYDDPSRIASLLVPSPAAPGTAAAPATPAAPAAPATPTDATKPDGRRRLPTAPRGAVVPGAAVPGAAVPGAAVPGAAVPGAAVPGAAVPGGGTVLRENNIERGGTVGQALPPGQTRPSVLSGPSRRGGAVQAQPWVRPQTNVDEDEEEGNNIYVPPPPPIPQPPSGVIYQPSLPSSGRLDIKAIPGRSTHRTDQVAALAAHRVRG